MLTSLNYSTAARFAAALIIVALGATSGSRGCKQAQARGRRASSSGSARAGLSLRALLLFHLESLLDLFDLRSSQRRQAVVQLAQRTLRQQSSRTKLECNHATSTAEP